MANLIGRSVIVSGRVQGVFYRASTQQEAKRLALTGCVKNLQSGDVFIEVFGKANVVVEFLFWCKVGPPMARVSGLEVETIEYKSLKSFEIKY